MFINLIECTSVGDKLSNLLSLPISQVHNTLTCKTSQPSKIAMLGLYKGCTQAVKHVQAITFMAVKDASQILIVILMAIVPNPIKVYDQRYVVFFWPHWNLPLVCSSSARCWYLLHCLVCISSASHWYLLAGWPGNKTHSACLK